MSGLRFENVTVRYGSARTGHTAAEEVTLAVPPGAIVGLVGESGSGKSTLARAAVGLAPVSEGRVLIDGVDVRRLPRRGPRPIQMIFQDPASAFDPRMTIGESITEAMPRGTRPSGSARRSRAQELLELVQLAPDRFAQYPRQLSGGQRQRAAVARALAGDPTVIIADEITSALDVSVQSAILNLVRDLQRELGLSMLFITHNLAVVRYVSDQIAVMQHGRIVEIGRTEKVMSDPQHPYTRTLIGAVPTFRA